LREVTVVIGNRVSKATRQGASLSAGDEELRVRIPSDVPQGCFVPLYLLETPTQASNVVTIAVKHGAGECSPGVIPKLSGTKLGLVTLFRTRMKTQDSNVESIRDEAKIVFGSADQGNETPGSFDSMVVLPPPGTCNAYVSGFVSEGLTSTVAFSAMGGLASTWDAGVALTFRRGAQSRTVGRLPNGWYSGNLGAGGAAAKRGTAGPFLEPGELIVESNGGADIGPFALKADAPAPFEWTDLEQTAVIDRHRGSTVHWRGIPGDRLVLVVATNVDQITTSTGTCICTARGSAGQLKIPAALLAHVPATQDIPGIPFDQLYVASISAKETIPVKGNGLTGAAAVGVYALGRIVEYR
jgi:hypothetical protein